RRVLFRSENAKEALPRDSEHVPGTTFLDGLYDGSTRVRYSHSHRVGGAYPSSRSTTEISSSPTCQRLKFSTNRSTMATCQSVGSPAMCGETSTFSSSQSGLSDGSGSTANTSNAAPAILPDASASASADSSRST